MNLGYTGCISAIKSEPSPNYKVRSPTIQQKSSQHNVAWPKVMNQHDLKMLTIVGVTIFPFTERHLVVKTLMFI
jgi:hypothetical protein